MEVFTITIKSCASSHMMHALQFLFSRLVFTTFNLVYVFMLYHLNLNSLLVTRKMTLFHLGARMQVGAGVGVGNKSLERTASKANLDTQKSTRRQ